MICGEGLLSILELGESVSLVGSRVRLELSFETLYLLCGFGERCELVLVATDEV